MKGQSGLSEELEQQNQILLRRFPDRPEVEAGLAACAVVSTAGHVRMLGKTGIVPLPVAARILSALRQIWEALASGEELLEPQDFDIYSGLERKLKELVGDEAVVVRTAKSTNDQIATDIRLWLRTAYLSVFERLLELRDVLVGLAERDLEIVMPGYTHMQPAEAILLSHWWLANESRFARDCGRLRDLYGRLNLLPLGAGVIAGAREPIDRGLAARYLGFDDVIDNSLDAISDRDYIVEFCAFATLVGLHLSQMGAELLLWATQEFAFISLPLHLSSGSHSLVFKRNPEVLELLRSRPSLIFGKLTEFVSQLKAVPTGFSLDLQESLPGLFEVVDTLKLLLDVSGTVLPGIEPDSRRMKEVACADLMNVNNALDYLTARGIEKAAAVRVVEHLATYCRTRNKYLTDLGLNEWQQFSPAFDADIYDYLSMEESIGAYCSFGGSSKEQVELAISRARQEIARRRAELSETSRKASLERVWGDV